MPIEIIQPEMADLIDPSTEIEKIADGFQFTEGPVWHPEKNCLFFSDIPADTIYKWEPDSGISIARKPSRQSNGLILNPQGHLIACEHQGRRVSIEDDQGVRTLVDNYQGKRLNSPNDIVLCRDGALIFTDPPYGLKKGPDGLEDQQLPFHGVFRLPPGTDEPILLVDDFDRPNGLAVTSDGKTLYVDDTARRHIRAFDVQPDGSLTNDRVFAELQGEGKGAPDGLKLDRNGNVFCTGPGGVWVFNPQGDLLGKIPMPAANLNWGDADRQALYLTAGTQLCRLRCKTGG